MRAKVTRREIIAEDLLEAVGELEEDAAVGNDPVAGAEAAHDLDRAILLRARLHRTLRELAGFLLHIDERLVLRIVQQGGYGHRENVLADSGANHGVYEHIFLEQPLGIFGDDPNRRGASGRIHHGADVRDHTVKSSRDRRIGFYHRVAHTDGRQIMVENVPLDPNLRDIAQDETDRGCGLNELARRDQLLHDFASQWSAHRQFRTDGPFLTLRFLDLLLGDASQS